MDILEQRSARRAMSAWLSEQINNMAAPKGMKPPAIRIQVHGDDAQGVAP